MDNSRDSDKLLLLSRLIKARIQIYFNYYRKLEDLEPFIMTCNLDGGLWIDLCLVLSFSAFYNDDDG